MALLNMPVSLYPSVAPPTVQIIATYPGADHNTIRDTVATVLEQEINGVERMIYLDSKSSNDGTYLGRVTFEIGTDPDAAVNLVQNRVNKAMPKLPATVKQLGITVAKVSPSRRARADQWDAWPTLHPRPRPGQHRQQAGALRPLW